MPWKREMYGTKEREKEKRWRGWCYPLIAYQTATASFIPFPLLFLSFSSSSSSSFSSRSFIPLHLWQQYLRATHPRDHGTPVRKRGIRNVIAPLRRVSWYTKLSSSFSSPPPVFISATPRPTTCIRKRHRTECITRLVYKVYTSRVLLHRSCLKYCRRSIAFTDKYTVFTDHVIMATNC